MRTFQKIVSVFVLSLGLVFFVVQQSQAQVDSTAKKDTVPATTQPAATTSTSTSSSKPKEKPTIILYAGPNISTLTVESGELDKESKTGFHVGLSWRSKGFLYTQFGLRYNNPVYSILPVGGSITGDHTFSVSALDIPITLGINILNATDKVLNLRGFISAMPSFNLGVGDNDYHIEKDDVESFVFYGQLGLGVDVLFMVFELGYNYGFSDLFKNTDKSKPGQGFLNIGFRF
jgi:hypothetical protein